MSHVNPDFSQVQVVLATYNGIRFLDEQIQSILMQLQEGQLLIHDDSSSDGTSELLQRWAARDPRIRLLSGPPQGGASANFSYLLEHTDAPYVFCAHQDDVWLPGELQLLLSRMRFYEGVYGEDTPLLVHSDLSLIDEQGRLIAPSMWQYQDLNPRWGDRFNLLLTQNVVTGCAVLVNRALLERALPVPPGASMHDHWLALVACGQGKIIWTRKPTVYYRQHINNNVGAHKHNSFQSFIRFANILRRQETLDEAKDLTLSIYSNAKSYVDRFPNTSRTQTAKNFSSLQSAHIFSRPYKILKNRFFLSSLSRNLSWIIQPSSTFSSVVRCFYKYYNRHRF